MAKSGINREPIRAGGHDRYEDLRPRAVTFDVGSGVTALAASLDDVIASKEVARRPKDLGHLPSLYAAREELQRERERGGREHQHDTDCGREP